jgi:hypothetical protein
MGYVRMNRRYCFCGQWVRQTRPQVSRLWSSMERLASQNLDKNHLHQSNDQEGTGWAWIRELRFVQV